MEKLVPSLIVSCFGLLFTGIVAGVAIYMWMKYRRFAAVEQVDIADLKEEIGKVRGKVVCEDDDLIQSPIHNESCVAFAAIVEELQTRTTTETVGGRTRHVTRTEWVPVFRKVDSADFTLKDKTGEVFVDLEGLQDFDLKNKERVETTPLSYMGTTWRRLANSFGSEFTKLKSGKYRLTEKTVMQGDKLLLFGPVTYKKGQPASFLGTNKKGKKQSLLVTDRSDEEMGKRLKKFALIFTVVAAVVALFFCGLTSFIAIMTNK